MDKPSSLTPLEAVNRIRDDNNGQVVVVLQGGGAREVERPRNRRK